MPDQRRRNRTTKGTTYGGTRADESTTEDTIHPRARSHPSPRACVRISIARLMGVQFHGDIDCIGLYPRGWRLYGKIEGTPSMATSYSGCRRRSYVQLLRRGQALALCYCFIYLG